MTPIQPRVRVVLQVLEPVDLQPPRVVTGRAAIVLAHCGDGTDSMRGVFHAGRPSDFIALGSSFVSWTLENLGPDALVAMMRGVEEIEVDPDMTERTFLPDPEQR